MTTETAKVEGDKCEECRFWDRYPDFRRDSKMVHPTHGKCRKRAPVIITEGEDAGLTAFPDMGELEWCGDFEAES